MTIHTPITAAPPTLDQIGDALRAMMPTGCNCISTNYYAGSNFHSVNLHDNRTPHGCVSGNGATLQDAFDKANAQRLIEIDAGKRSYAEAEFGACFADMAK